MLNKIAAVIFTVGTLSASMAKILEFLTGAKNLRDLFGRPFAKYLLLLEILAIFPAIPVFIAVPDNLGISIEETKQETSAPQINYLRIAGKSSGIVERSDIVVVISVVVQGYSGEWMQPYVFANGKGEWSYDLVIHKDGEKARPQSGDTVSIRALVVPGNQAQLHEESQNNGQRGSWQRTASSQLTVKAESNVRSVLIR